MADTNSTKLVPVFASVDPTTAARALAFAERCGASLGEVIRTAIRQQAMLLAKPVGTSLVKGDRSVTLKAYVAPEMKAALKGAAGGCLMSTSLWIGSALADALDCAEGRPVPAREKRGPHGAVLPVAA
jgi:hypothetical protein